MDDQIKATDILIILQKKLEEVLAYQKNQDLLLKRLSHQISELQDKLLSGQSISKETSKQEVPSTSITKTLPGLKPGIKVGKFEGLDRKQVDVSASFIEEKDEAPPTVSLQDLKEQNKKRGTRTVSQNKPMPVKQSLKYPDGRPVAMAKVDIYDGDKINLISSIKSSVLGEWVENLSPNNYIVVVSKKQAGDKPAVNAEFSLEVPQSNAPLKLDDLTVDLI